MDRLNAGRRRLPIDWAARLVDPLAFGLAAYALYWVLAVVDTQIYRVSFLLLALVLTFLIYPGRSTASARDVTGDLADPELRTAVVAPGAATARAGTRVPVLDWILAALSIVALAWPIVDFDRFVFRAATPTTIDLVCGALSIALVLEATRRTVGAILPVTALLFLVYGYFGPVLDRIGLSIVAHRGYAPDRLVGSLYMSLEGIFGVPLDVAATYIVLFTIYGAILEQSGAGRFFVDWALAGIGRSGHGAGPGRTVTVAGYLLGSISGSGVATTVMLGSVTWPIMRRAGYSPDVAGAVLAAAGIGAILAPPAMGAAAFLIAEYLRITYFQVIAMAVIPAALYYLSIFLMVEADSRRLRLRPIDLDLPSFATITRRGWFHFLSLAAIVVLMGRGMTAFRAVFWAMVIATALSFLDRNHALWPRRLAAALAKGGRSVLPVVATTATAGIIVGIVTLTGLGLKVASLILTLAGSSPFLTVVYSAVAVWMLGLAVPVTASYILAAVMIAPALTQVGVPDVAAHMFIFYYAVLSEVSPPTALSPFAAAAVTGGNPFKTTMLSWKYTAPAFVVPFVFTLDARGLGVLLQTGIQDTLWMTMAAAAGVAGVAAGAGGWMRAAASPVERVSTIVGGLLLFVPRGWSVLSGALLLAVALCVHWVRTRPGAR